VLRRWHVFECMVWVNHWFGDIHIGATRDRNCSKKYKMIWKPIECDTGMSNVTLVYGRWRYVPNHRPNYVNYNANSLTVDVAGVWHGHRNLSLVHSRFDGLFPLNSIRLYMTTHST
jgi:hypothetical protein